MSEPSVENGLQLGKMTEKEIDMVAGQSPITFNDGLLLVLIFLKASGQLRWSIGLTAAVYFAAIIGLALFSFAYAYVWDRFVDWWNR